MQWTGIGFALAISVGSLSTVPVSSAKALVFKLPPRTEPLVLIQAQGAPQSEAILRKTIRDLQERKPDYEAMEPELQKAVKEQFEHTADIYRHLGALKTLRYIGTKDGLDVYRAVYENAAVTYTIRLSPSGKISVLLLQPAFPWE